MLGVTLTLRDHRVKDVEGSGCHGRRSRTWRRFWEMKTGLQFPEECRRYDCWKKAEVGAHVFVDCIYEGNFNHRENFILPSCTECNQKNQKKHFDPNRDSWGNVKSGAKVAWTTPF